MCTRFQMSPPLILIRLYCFRRLFNSVDYLPSLCRFGFNVKRISPSCFELSETVIKDSIARIAFLWNMGFRNIRLLAKGDDWNNFFKVCSAYYIKVSKTHLPGNFYDNHFLIK